MSAPLTCAHGERLWVVSPGPRVACVFAFCDTCGTKLDLPAIEALVKERYPDRPFDWWALPPAEETGWELACKSRWVRFLYPGGLVGALMEAVPVRAPFYRSWLED